MEEQPTTHESSRLSVCATDYNLRDELRPSSQEHTEPLRWGQCGLSDLDKSCERLYSYSCMYMDVLCSEGYETRGGGTSMLGSCESGGVLSHVQHLTKILVGLSQDTPVKIYSNKEFSQLQKVFYETNKYSPTVSKVCTRVFATRRDQKQRR